MPLDTVRPREGMTRGGPGYNATIDDLMGGMEGGDARARVHNPGGTLGAAPAPPPEPTSVGEPIGGQDRILQLIRMLMGR
jgi:hypothetical protein